MNDRVDEHFARYAEVADRMATHGPDSLSDDDFRLIAAVTAAMHQAALCELDRRASRKLWDLTGDRNLALSSHQERH